jgi:antitoxin HicB
VVTSPVLPELVTAGETVEEALRNASDAVEAIVEAFHDLGRPLPEVLQSLGEGAPVSLEAATSTRFTSEEIQRVLFPSPPGPRTLAELKEGARRYVKDRRTRS